MTKMHQRDQIHDRHISSDSSIRKALVQQAGDDSPVSVITHGALVSQPSSTCTSMEHRIYRDSRAQSFQDHGYSTSSDDDASYSNGAELSNERLKVGNLESLPETRSVSLSLSPKKMGYGADSLRMRASFPKNQVSEHTSPHSDASETDEQRITAKGSTIPPMHPLAAYKGGKVFRCATMDKGVKNTCNKRLTSSTDQSSKIAFMPESEESEPAEDLQQRKMLSKKAEHEPKSMTINSSNGVVLEIVAKEGSKKRYGSQGGAAGMARTCPTPGKPSLLPSRCSFSDVQNFVGHHFYGYNNFSANESGQGNRGLHDYIPNQLAKPGMSLKLLPSKWEEAGKWLHNVTGSPCHPGSKLLLPTALAAANQLQEGMVGKRDANAVHPTAAIATVRGGREIPGGKIPGNRYYVIYNETEHAIAAPEYRGPVSTSQKSRLAEKVGKQNVDADAKNDPLVKYTPGKLSLHYVESAKNTDGTHDSALRTLGVKQQGFPGRQQQESAQDKHAGGILEISNIKRSNLLQHNEFVIQTRNGRSTSMKDAATEISPSASRRDMATQITPVSSSRTSRCTTPIKDESPARHNTPTSGSASSSNAPGTNPLELESCHLAKLELRDLPAGSQFQSFDKSASSWNTREEEDEESSKYLRQADTVDPKNALETKAAAWEETERMKHSTKYKREEARIQAWENHQKAKADAELKKLEVKVEKLLSHATEKIMNKLAMAHRKAEQMRAAARALQAEQIARTIDHAARIRKSGHMSAASFGICFVGLS